MHKSLLKIVMVTTAVTCLFTGSTAAQSIFGFNANKNQTQTSSQPGQTANHVMSPDEFKGTVGTLTQQTNNNLTQQLNNDVAKQAKLSPPIQGAGGPNNNPPPPPSDNNQGNNPTTNTNTSSSSNEVAPTTQPSAPTYPPANNQFGTNVSTGAPVLAAPAPPPPASTQPSQGQPYSGFGTGTTTRGGTQNTAPSSGNTGGFNIKY